MGFIDLKPVLMRNWRREIGCGQATRGKGMGMLARDRRRLRNSQQAFGAVRYCLHHRIGPSFAPQVGMHDDLWPKAGESNAALGFV